MHRQQQHGTRAPVLRAARVVREVREVLRAAGSVEALREGRMLIRLVTITVRG
jgi:hypothetical protein